MWAPALRRNTVAAVLLATVVQLVGTNSIVRTGPPETGAGRTDRGLTGLSVACAAPGQPVHDASRPFRSWNDVLEHGATKPVR
jgi:hypothetical protein